MPAPSETLKSWLPEILKIAGIIISMVFAYTSITQGQALMQQRLDVIEGNHLAHLQKSYEELAKEQVEIGKAVVRIETMLATWELQSKQ